MTDNENVIATIKTSVGDMKISFLSDLAPGHVENFMSLAEKGFYNNLNFHRTVRGFMIQGGCPAGNGGGGPGYNIKAEFNDTNHIKGTVSMARSGDPDSGGSQFFICHAAAPHLNGKYTAFGQLIEGEDVLDAIATAPVKPNPGGEQSTPLDPVTIKTITFEMSVKTDD
jgi:peptidyl-prolyl cis-trans isomerase B (cyclophilin B)